MHCTATAENQTKGNNSEVTALPCLNSNISIETIDQASSVAHADGELGWGEGDIPPPPKLSTQHRKTSFILRESVQLLAESYGIEKLGFLTLTFKDHVQDPKAAQRRLNSLLSNVIKPRYQEYVGVMERQKSGRIHYHFLVVLSVDIRSGCNFEAFTRRDYRSAPGSLREEWSFWRSTAPKYRFGRTELLPVRSTTEAIAKYVGKYIAKHCEARKPIDKGVRLVRYSTGARAGTTRFQFHSQGSRDWRAAVSLFATIVQINNPGRKVSELADLSEVLGKRWAYHHREYILGLSEMLNHGIKSADIIGQETQSYANQVLGV